MQIHSCTSERIKLENGSTGQYAVVKHGPGMDCPSGCIYEGAAAIVLPDHIAVLPAPFRRDDLIIDDIGRPLGVFLPADILKSADRRFREKDGQWQMVLTFRKYLKASVIVNPDSGGSEVVEFDGRTPGEIQTKVWEQHRQQCQGPDHQPWFTEFQPREDGSWRGSFRWTRDRTISTAFAVSPTGAVTFPEGCGK